MRGRQRDPERYSLFHYRVGKKSRFNVSVKDLKTGENLYGLIDTARVKHSEPYLYIRFQTMQLPNAATAEAMETLLPGNLNNYQVRHC